MNIIKLWWEYNARKWHKAFDREHAKVLELVRVVHDADERAELSERCSSTLSRRMAELTAILDAAGLLDLVDTGETHDKHS